MRKNQYRIVTDGWAGYEAQVKYWWFPFLWFQCETNTHSTIESAEEYARNHAERNSKKHHKAKFVKLLGELP